MSKLWFDISVYVQTFCNIRRILENSHRERKPNLYPLTKTTFFFHISKWEMKNWPHLPSLSVMEMSFLNLECWWATGQPTYIQCFLVGLQNASSFSRSYSVRTPWHTLPWRFIQRQSSTCACSSACSLVKQSKLLCKHHCHYFNQITHKTDSF